MRRRAKAFRSKLVGGWALHTALAAGEMHIISEGKASSALNGSYANYAARGYELMGYKLKPVSSTLPTLSVTWTMPSQPSSAIADGSRRSRMSQRRWNLASLRMAN